MVIYSLQLYEAPRKNKVKCGSKLSKDRTERIERTVPLSRLIDADIFILLSHWIERSANSHRLLWQIDGVKRASVAVSLSRNQNQSLSHSVLELIESSLVVDIQ